MTAMADHEGNPPTSSPDAFHSRPDKPSAAKATPALDADNALFCSKGQHCGAAGFETVKLPLPREAFHASASTRLLPSPYPATTRSTERGPPELSVLSQLRI